MLLFGTRPRIVWCLIVAQWLLARTAENIKHAFPSGRDVRNKRVEFACFKNELVGQLNARRSYASGLPMYLRLRGGNAEMGISSEQDDEVLESEPKTEDCELSSIPSAAYKEVSKNSDDDELGDDFDLSQAMKQEDDVKEISEDPSDPEPMRKQSKRRDDGRKDSVPPSKAQNRRRGENRTDDSEPEDGGIRKQLECTPRELDLKLLAAATAGDTDKIRALVKRGADPDAREGDVAALRALHRAALSGRTEAVAALVELGAPLARKSGTEDTALHYAAEAGRVCTRAAPRFPAPWPQALHLSTTPPQPADLEQIDNQRGCAQTHIRARAHARARARTHTHTHTQKHAERGGPSPPPSPPPAPRPPAPPGGRRSG